MDLNDVLKMIGSRTTVPLWPDAGQALGLSRGQTYRCASTGEIETLKFGHLKLVTTSWLKRKLGLDEARA